MDDIREQIAKELYFEGEHFEEGSLAVATWRDMPDGMRKKYLERADLILNIKCSRGGGVCPTCRGEKELIFGKDAPRPLVEPCPTCKGTGSLPIEAKEVKEIIEEWENGKERN